MSTTLYTVAPVTKFSAQGYDIVQAGTVVPDGVVWAIQAAAAGAGVTLNTSAGGAPQLVQVPSYYNGGTGSPVGDSLPVGAEVKDSTGAVFEKTPGGWISAVGASALAPTVTAPSSPSPNQVWSSSSLQDVRVSPSAADRRVILVGNGGWEGALVQEPSVWIANNLYNMLYTGGGGSPAIGYASCPLTADPTVAANWTKNANPVIGQTHGGFAGGLYHGNLYVEGSTLYFYATPSATNSTLETFTASISDPLTWTHTGQAMASLPYTAVGFGNTFILKSGSTYYMIFEMSVNNWQLGMATATSPTGTFTATQNAMNSLWPLASSTASGPWATIEGSTVVLYYHAGPKVSGSLPTEIYRATIPLASFGTDAWTVRHNKKPIVRRMASVEVDQVADPYVVTNAAGVSYLFYEGYDNSTSTSQMICLPLLPVQKRWDGNVWALADAAFDSGQSVTQPGKPAAALLATDVSISTAAFATVVAVNFTPTGTKALVRISGMANTPGSAATYYHQIVQTGGATNKLGSASGFGNQQPHSGGTIFTGLTPGTTYTFTYQVDPTAGTWACRPVSFPNSEQMLIVAEDCAYPASSS